MWPPLPYIAVIAYYTYKRSYLFSGHRWSHICYGLYLYIYGSDAIACYAETQIFHFSLSEEIIFNIIFKLFFIQFIKR